MISSRYMKVLFTFNEILLSIERNLEEDNDLKNKVSWEPMIGFEDHISQHEIHMTMLIVLLKWKFISNIWQSKNTCSISVSPIQKTKPISGIPSYWFTYYTSHFTLDSSVFFTVIIVTKNVFPFVMTMMWFTFPSPETEISNF